MKNSKILLLLILISGSFLCCKKERLTKATQNGANTFSCKIDGKVFVAKVVYSVPTMPGLSASYSLNTKKFEIYAIEPRDKSENGLTRDVNIEIYDPKQGTNLLNSKDLGQVVISEYNQLDRYYLTSNTINGSVTITKFDTSTHVISGSFSFRATHRTNPNSIIKITDGRFDITYK